MKSERADLTMLSRHNVVAQPELTGSVLGNAHPQLPAHNAERVELLHTS